VLERYYLQENRGNSLCILFDIPAQAGIQKPPVQAHQMISPDVFDCISALWQNHRQQPEIKYLPL